MPPMTRGIPIWLMLLGTVLGQALIVAGLWLVFAQALPAYRWVPGLALLAAGLYLGMTRVIDPLVPNAGRVFVGSLKSLMALAFYACAALTLYSVFSGTASDLLHTLQRTGYWPDLYNSPANTRYW